MGRDGRDPPRLRVGSVQHGAAQKLDSYRQRGWLEMARVDARNSDATEGGASML